MIPIDNALLQLERLRRHYDVAVRTYDDVTFLDLSHSLRIWVDLKQQLVSAAPSFSQAISFKTGLPARKVIKAARNREFIFCYMPGGVKTYAAKGQLASGPRGNSGGHLSGVAFKIEEDHIWLDKFSFVSPELDNSLIGALNAHQQQRCNFQQWLGAEAVRLSFRSAEGELRPVQISRETLVKRVANTLGGSHPSTAPGETDNIFDPPVRYLLQYKCGGLPLPYFILLKMAQDILEFAPGLLAEPKGPKP